MYAFSEINNTPLVTMHIPGLTKQELRSLLAAMYIEVANCSPGLNDGLAPVRLIALVTGFTEPTVLKHMHKLRRMEYVSQSSDWGEASWVVTGHAYMALDRNGFSTPPPVEVDY